VAAIPLVTISWRGDQTAFLGGIVAYGHWRASGKVALYNAAGTINAILDVAGWFQ
jgi:hypothetical protein